MGSDTRSLTELCRVSTRRGLWICAAMLRGVLSFATSITDNPSMTTSDVVLAVTFRAWPGHW